MGLSRPPVGYLVLYFINMLVSSNFIIPMLGPRKFEENQKPPTPEPKAKENHATPWDRAVDATEQLHQRKVRFL